MLTPTFVDLFLCHAWDDRAGAAKELHDLLEANNVSVWFSEKDVVLGAPLLREIDKGLAKSRAGIVLVTPALLTRLKSRDPRERARRRAGLAARQGRSLGGSARHPQSGRRGF